MPSLDFKFKPSKQYLALLTLTLVVSVGIVLALTFAPWIKFVLIMLIAFYGSYLLWAVAVLRGKQAITRVKYLNDKSWSVFTQQGIYIADLRGDSMATNIVSILRFQIPDQHLPLSCVVFRDSLDGHDYRELLVALRTLARP
jgi:hypothetical protein